MWTSKPPAGTPINWSHPINRGLVSYWPMLEGSGIRTTDIVSGHGGILTAGPTWTGGQYGHSLGFDLTDDYIDIGSVPRLQNGVPFTIVWREKVAAGGALYPSRFRLVVTNTALQGFVLIRSGDATFAPLAWGGAHTVVTTGSFKAVGAPTLAAAVGQWRHWALVGFVGPGGSASTDYAVYVDGVPYATANASAFGTVSNTINRIGYDALDSASNASIDDARIYNRALNGAEVRQLYAQPYAGFVDDDYARWYVAAGGGGFQSAWARGANVMIQGGAHA